MSIIAINRNGGAHLLTFGEELRNIRKQKKLSLKEVAKKGELSHSYISQIENGKRNAPKPEIIHKLAFGLDIDSDELMYKAGYINRKTYSDKLSENLSENKKELAEYTKEYLSEQLDALKSKDTNNNISIYDLLMIKNAMKIAQELKQENDSDDSLEHFVSEKFKQLKLELSKIKLSSITDSRVDIAKLKNIDLYYNDELLTIEDKDNIIKFIDNFIIR